MKIYYSPMSPFVRKVLVVAYELSLQGLIENLDSAAHPIERDANIVAHNPLGQVPTFLTDDGVLYDSRVICEYLDHLGQGLIFPKNPARRWVALRQQALSDGVIAAALAIRYENITRPEEKRFDKWVVGQAAKINDSINVISEKMDEVKTFWDIGTISMACMLSYLDLRLPEIKWREGHLDLANWYKEACQRNSMKATNLGGMPTLGVPG